MTELLKNITWTQYLLITAGLITVYYIAIALLFYRTELLQALKGATKNQYQAGEQGDENLPDQYNGELMDDLEGTVEDIAHRILVPGTKVTKPELLRQLKERVANFGGLSRPGYRYALNHFIIDKAKENCGVDFSEEELEEEWDSLPR